MGYGKKTTEKNVNCFIGDFCHCTVLDFCTCCKNIRSTSVYSPDIVPSSNQHCESAAGRMWLRQGN